MATLNKGKHCYKRKHGQAVWIIHPTPMHLVLVTVVDDKSLVEASTKSHSNNKAMTK
jgi:hypothetical protein